MELLQALGSVLSYFGEHLDRSGPAASEKPSSRTIARKVPTPEDEAEMQAVLARC
jgi:hypothetical protein